jgi:hypothetical protein
LVLERLGWAPSQPLRAGLEQTFNWINTLVQQRRAVGAITTAVGAS